MVNDIHKSVLRNILLLIVFFLPAIATLAKSEKVNFPVNKALYFVENKGQVIDQFGKQRNEIDFRLATGKLNMFVGAGQLHYQWLNHVDNKDGDGSLIESYRLDVSLVGANKFVQPIFEQKIDYYENYYTAHLDGVRAYAFGKVVYKNIYNNIDWVLYIQDGGVKYDFIVHPGGNIADIRMQYDGATEMAMSDGDIVVNTPYGSITEKAPYTYNADTKEPLASSYRLESNNVSFDVAKHTGTVVIDPSLEWATYMGGADHDFGMCAASDTAGNVYLGGRTASGTSSNVFTSGAHQVVFGGAEDGVVTRYTAGGVRQWSTFYGGNKNDAIHSITVDIENNIVFAGVTDSSVSGIATSTGHKPVYCGGASDAFLVKMDITGVRLWATYYGGAGKERDGNDYQVGVICDTAKNIYLAGITNSDTGIITTGTQQTSRAGDYDGFLAKFNKNGGRIWGTYYGGTDKDQFTNVSVDSNGTPYVVGKFQSSGMGTVNTHLQNKPSAGNSTVDILIGKFNQYTGARTWATYYGGSDEEQSRGIVVGDTNYVYICGSTLSTSGIASSTAQQPNNGGYFDMFLAKFDSTGKRLWGTFFGGSGTDHGGNVVIDHKGNLNVTGITASDNDIATTDAFRSVRNLGQSTNAFDALIAIYNPYGEKIWSTYYGGAENDYGFGVARGKSYGHIYITGNSGSNAGISFNGSQNTHGGLNDAFMVKITPDTSVSLAQNTVKNVYCEQDTFTIDYVTTEPFRAGNVFTAQLSDATGSFVTPYNIGSVSSVGVKEGKIFIKLPPNVSGTKFRIRIVGTAPIDTSYDNEIDILIKPLPTWPIASNNSPTCSNDTLRLNSTASSAGVAYSWTGPDNFTASAQNVIRTNMTASLHSGDYIVTADLNGCVRKDTTTAVIKQAADKPNLTTNAPLCSRETLILTATTTSTGHITEWYHIDGTWNDITSNVMNIARLNVSTDDDGRYVVVLKQNGCESKDTVNVVISEKPEPVIASSPDIDICAHDTLFLFAVCNTAGVTYTWTGPGVSSNDQNPVLTNLGTFNSGNYIVTASKNGCATRDTIENIIIRQSPPIPVATTNATPLCSDDVLKLIAGSIGAGTPTWKKLPNGAVIPGQPGGTTTIPNAQITDGGNYELTSTIGTCSLKDTVYVDIIKSHRFNVTPVISPGTAVCPTDTITFDVIANPPIPGSPKYTWRGPGLLVPSTDMINPKVENIKYSDSGYYVVTVVGTACSLAIDSVHLAVVDTLSPPVLTLPPFACIGSSMTLRPTHPYLRLFYLEYPGGKDTGAAFTYNSVQVATHKGRYIAMVKSGGCRAYDTAYLNDLRPTPAVPDITSNSPVCEDKTLNMDATSSTSGSSYIWRGPGGFISTVKSPVLGSVKPTVHSGFYVSRAVLNGCESESDSVFVVVNPNPVPEIISEDVFCEGGVIYLKAKNKQGETYTWEGGAGFSAIGAEVSKDDAKLADKGNYVLTATITETGCTATAVANIEITPLPGKPDATYREPLCVGDKLELSLTDTSTGAIGYIWKGPGSFTFLEKDAFKNDVTMDDSGMYVVTASREGCVISDTVWIRVRPRPAKPVIVSNSPVTAGETLVLNVSNPEPGATFKWKGPNGFGSLAQDPTIDKITVSASGTYTVTTTLDGCPNSTSAIITVNKGDGKIDQMVLFPNPNKGVFTIKAKLSHEQIMPFEVLNTLGMVVYSDIAISQDMKMERTVELDGTLANGFYIFRIMLSGKSIEVPFSIVR